MMQKKSPEPQRFRGFLPSAWCGLEIEVEFCQCQWYTFAGLERKIGRREVIALLEAEYNRRTVTHTQCLL